MQRQGQTRLYQDGFATSCTLYLSHPAVAAYYFAGHVFVTC